MRTCTNYQEDVCILGLEQFKPSEEYCASCKHYKGPSRGLGDDVANALKKTGVEKVVNRLSGGKECGCGKRRAALNRVFPKDKSDG